MSHHDALSSALNLIKQERTNIHLPLEERGKRTSLMFILCTKFGIENIPFKQYMDTELDDSFVLLAIKQQCSLDQVIFMLRNGADINKHYVTHEIAKYDPIYLISLSKFIQSKNAVDPEGYTPLDYVKDENLRQTLKRVGYYSYLEDPLLVFESLCTYHRNIHDPYL